MNILTLRRILVTRSQILIQRAFNSGAWYAARSKTSLRRIHIGPSTMTALKRRHMVWPINDQDMIFPNSVVQPIDHNSLINRHFRQASEAAGIERIIFHDLWHTYASLLTEQGENIKSFNRPLSTPAPPPL